ncbi:MAG: T9SS type A sorting domain-containing protein [Bacteroidota bacterium]
MKFYSYLVGLGMLCLGLTGHIFAQTNADACEDKNIQTYPPNAQNDEISPTDLQRLNWFDWTTINYDINSAYINAAQVPSPYYQDDNGIVSHFFENKDMDPDDGWELIKQDVGKTLDGTANATTPTDFVYVVLYNRYSGKLRIFVAGDYTVPFNGAKITIKVQENPVSSNTALPSILSHSSTLKAVESFSEDDIETVSASEFKNGLAEWFYAEFNMAYDPCVCSYESLVEANVQLIERSLITLSGDITGEITNIENKQNKDNDKPTENGWSVSAKDLETLYKTGVKSYKSGKAFVDKQKKALKVEGKSNLQLKVEELTKVNKLNDFQELLKGNETFSSLLDIVPYVGPALDIVKFFSGVINPKPATPQLVKVSPMAINSTVKLNGEIVGVFDFADIIFYTPGSLNAETRQASRYARYNEPVGIFNLLETPVVRTYTKVNADISPPIKGSPPSRKYTYETKFQIKSPLSSNIKYVINPAIDYVGEPEIMGYLEVRTPNGELTTIGQSVIAATRELDVEEHVYRTPPVPIEDLDLVGIKLKRVTFAPVGLGAYELYVRVFVKLNHVDSNGDKKSTLWVGSFPATEEITTTSFNFTGPYSSIPTESTITGPISSNRYAWSKLILDQGTVFTNGSTPITLIAPEIEVRPGVIVPPNVTLTLGTPTDLEGRAPLPPQSQTQIESFCGGNKYQSPQRDLRLANTQSGADVDLSYALSIQAAPNPFDHTTTLAYSIQDPGSVSVAVYDLNGRQVLSLVDGYHEAGEYKIKVEGDQLASGYYQAVIQTQNARQTAKLVKL